MANGPPAQSRVGVLGSGEIGRRLAAGFCSRGHDVMIGSRDPGKPELREWPAKREICAHARVSGTNSYRAKHSAIRSLTPPDGNYAAS